MIRFASSVLCALALVASTALQAQAEKVRVVGYLSIGSGPCARERAFQDQLRALGWVEGQNLKIEFRRAANDSNRLAAMAGDRVIL